MLKALWLLLLALFTTRDDTDTDLDDDTTTDGDDSHDKGGDDDGSDDDDDSGAGGADNDLDPEVMRSEMEKARKQAAKYRTERNTEREKIASLEQQNQAILKALGIADDDEDDPSTKADQFSAENRRLRTQLSFAAHAREAGADEDLTWAYLLARGEIDALDPTSDDFDEVLQASIASALEAKPGLATKPRPPSKGGADLDSDDNPANPRPEEMEMDDYAKWRAERLKE